MTWTPARWAWVWARRLAISADQPHCRHMFRRSVQSCEEPLRTAFPPELFTEVRESSESEDPVALKAVSNRLEQFAAQHGHA